jgi:N6-adenosine-specific RNA methylase IME4
LGSGVSDPFADLPRNHFGAVLCDPPWLFRSLWGGRPVKTEAGYASRAVEQHYDTLTHEEIAQLPVGELAADDSVLFMWICWPILPQAMKVIEAWGFTYKTCAFAWIKAHAAQIEMFRDDIDPFCGLGYWTRSNSEVCLLATRGKPKRWNADVLQGIIEPRRQHSRKPDCVYDRIERLVPGPYLELFARSTRPNWTSWGNQVGKFGEVAAE